MALNNSADRYPKYRNNKNHLIHNLKACRFQHSDKCNLLFPTNVEKTNSALVMLAFCVASKVML